MPKVKEMRSMSLPTFFYRRAARLARPTIKSPEMSPDALEIIGYYSDEVSGGFSSESEEEKSFDQSKIVVEDKINFKPK